MTSTTTQLSWGKSAIRLANDMAADGFNRGDLAALRRMDPDEPDAAAFWRLAARYDLKGGPELERRWALVMHGIALMTRRGSDAAARSAHVRAMPIGRAMFEGGKPDTTSAYYSESRLNRLLTARGNMLRTLLRRMFRMMATANQGFDWYQMAELILSDGFDERVADRVRRNIARHYYWTENRATYQ